MKFKVLGKLAMASVAVLGMSAVSAEQYWSDFSVSYLQGNDYLNPFTGEERTSKVMTLEHASGHSWGSTFMFVDRLTNDDDSADETYGEIGANYNVYSSKDGFIKNAYVAAQMEFQSQDSGFTNYLYGVGVNLNIPTASFFNVTLFKRNQDDLGFVGLEDNEQLTIVWRWDWDEIRFDGFWDIVSGTDNNFGDVESGFNFVPQLTYNIGPALGMKTGRLGVGIEYVYWKNKFGVDGQDEKNLNLLLKWHF